MSFLVASPLTGLREALWAGTAAGAAKPAFGCGVFPRAGKACKDAFVGFHKRQT